MKMISYRLLFCLCLAISAFLVQSFGQSSDPRTTVPDWVRTNEESRREMQRTLPTFPSSRETIIIPSNPAARPDGERDGDYATADESEVDSEEYQAKYGISRDYRKKYQSFLNLSDTGIIRIFPNKNCGGTSKIVTVAELERCSDVPPENDGGSIWSFRCRKDHLGDCRRKQNVDLKFKDGMFFTGNGVVQGIMADLGDIDPAEIRSTDGAVKFIDAYNPKQSLPKIAAQDLILASGIKGYGNYVYTNSAAAKLNSTYILRAVLYRYHEPGQLSVPLRGVDVRVVFKVVAREPDGSIIIIWKELDRQYPRRKISD